MSWDAALKRLRSVSTLTNEAYLRFLSQYFIGRTYQNIGDHEAARHAFEQANEIAPHARSAATQLAGELLIDERLADRVRAYEELQLAYSDSAPDDPWRLYGHGDARLWPLYMARLRQALK